MNYEDLIYLTLLVFCIVFGIFYKKIEDLNTKKWIGTLVGVFIVLIASGIHVYHTLICWFIGTFIIVFINARRSHLICFGFLFSYLLFTRMTSYFNLSLPPGHSNLIHMILTLKVVGLAFEKNNADTKSREIESADIGAPLKTINLTPAEKEILNLNFVDIFHYSFNYVGVLTGPYYTYRTFRDYWNLPYRKNVDCTKATIDKIKFVPLFGLLYLIVSYIWPLSYATDPEFYEQRSFFYRIMYVWPTFFIYRMRIYTGLTLSECVCTMAGFGAYPKEVASKPGAGPTKEYLNLPNTPDKCEYDFETIHNIDAYTTDTCWTFREAMKSWNMCIQYWLAVNIYKRFPSKKFRTLATLFISAFWHGVYPGYYVCMLGPPFYLPIEDLYHKLFRDGQTGIKRLIIDVGFWIAKFFAFSYMGIAFLLMTLDKIWFYYSSVYHFGYILWLVMYIVGVMIDKQRKTSNKKTKESIGISNNSEINTKMD